MRALTKKQGRGDSKITRKTPTPCLPREGGGPLTVEGVPKEKNKMSVQAWTTANEKYLNRYDQILQNACLTQAIM